MFCALNGATFRPRRAYQRHSAVASQLLPAPLVVPSTITQRAVIAAMAQRRARVADDRRSIVRHALNSLGSATH